MLICSGFMSRAQPDSPCIGQELFTQIYPGNLEQARVVLREKQWFLLSNEYHTHLIIGQDTLDYNLAIWKNPQTFDNHYLYYYYHESLSNYVECVTGEGCFERLHEYAVQFFEPNYIRESTSDYVSSSFNAAPHFQVVFTRFNTAPFTYTITCFNQAEIDNIILNEREMRAHLRMKIKKQKELVERTVRIADGFMERNEYQNAYFVLDTLPDLLPEYRNIVERKKKVITEEMKRQKMADLTIEAEALFENRNYRSALLKYREVLGMDRHHETALLRIGQIEKMLEVLSSRSVLIYDYQVLNPDSWLIFQKQLETDLNTITGSYPAGKTVFDCTLRFDTLGTNRSGYAITENTVAELPSLLDKLTRSQFLTPTYSETILVSSSSNIHIDLLWQTRYLTKKKKGIRIKTHNPGKAVTDRPQIASYMRNATLPDGRYTFAVKDKIVDNRQLLSDINLVKFKTTGAEAGLYSMLVPGLGTLIATNGQKGTGSMISFFLVGGGSLACFLYGQHLFKKAEAMKNRNPESFDQDSYNRQIDNSQLFKYASYLGFGVSGVLYVSDVIHAFSRGIKNMKSSREMRRLLKNSPIEIIREDIIL